MKNVLTENEDIVDPRTGPHEHVETNKDREEYRDEHDCVYIQQSLPPLYSMANFGLEA